MSKVNSFRLFSLIILFGLLSLVITPAKAYVIPDALKSAIPPPNPKSKSWVLMDYNTGWIIAENNADQRIEPASLSKLMTAFVVFAELKNNKLKLDDQVSISENAWRTEGSRMFVKVNTHATIIELLKGLVIQSGNDAAVALAEHMAGSEEGFAAIMNQQAKILGLVNTHFMNSTGLPHKDHYSSALDMTKLSAALIREFPEYYEWYSEKEYTYNDITQQNRNLLLWSDPSVDGVKTGHTNSAGYCLVGSARRDHMRLIATVIGTDSMKKRTTAVQTLLKFGFASYDSKQLFPGQETVRFIKVYKGVSDEIAAGFNYPIYTTVAKSKSDRITATLSVMPWVEAPVARGQKLGKVEIKLDEQIIAEAPLRALQNIEVGGWWTNLIDSVWLWWKT